jgi:hypothetical protein
MEIAKILKTTVGTVYVVRAAAKKDKADTSNWYSQHTQNAKKIISISSQNSYRESKDMVTPFRGYQFTEPTKEPFQKAPSFVQRLKSAFSALMGN